MHQILKTHLTQNEVDLADNLTVNILLIAFMKSKGIFTKAEAIRLTVVKDREGEIAQSAEFFKILSQKEDDAYEHLMKELRTSNQNQKAVAKTLEEGWAAYRQELQIGDGQMDYN